MYSMNGNFHGLGMLQCYMWYVRDLIFYVLVIFNISLVFSTENIVILTADGMENVGLATEEIILWGWYSVWTKLI